MSAFVVDTELLVEFVRRMSACEAELERVEDEIDSRMKRLHATWQGEAASLHAVAQQRWVAGSRQTHEALTVLRSIAATADENYSSAMSANRQMWAQ